MAIDYKMYEDGSIEEMEISFNIDPARWIHLLGALADSLVDRSNSLIVEERLELSFLIRDLLPDPEQFAELRFTPENMPSPELIAENYESILETQKSRIDDLLYILKNKGVNVPDNINIPVNDGNANSEDEVKGE